MRGHISHHVLSPLRCGNRRVEVLFARRGQRADRLAVVFVLDFHQWTGINPLSINQEFVFHLCNSPVLLTTKDTHLPRAWRLGATQAGREPAVPCVSGICEGDTCPEPQVRGTAFVFKNYAGKSSAVHSRSSFLSDSFVGMPSGVQPASL